MNRWLHWLATAAAVMAACTGTSDPTDPLKSGVQVSFSTRPLTPTAVSSALASPVLAPMASPSITVSGDTLSDGTNTLIIDKAELVVRKVELEPSGSNQCSETTGCEEVAAGPALVDLPLSPGAQPQFSIDAPTGAYHEITFEVHKVGNSDSADQAFRTAHPEVADQSVMVQGRFNGQSFTFLSDLTAEQELELSPAIQVTAGGAAVNVTIRVDVSTWFRTSAGGLLDPATANKGGANESRVAGNIQKSMNAFEDSNHDGNEHND
jgi:hypothetical protein